MILFKIFINLFITVTLELVDGVIKTIFEHEEFNLLQIHFHWGHSEHEINGTKYDSELHLVHKSSVDENKFAVLGYLFKV